MANYIWEFGIDWNAVTGPANASYLDGAFIQAHSRVIERPCVVSGDTIIFKIFNVTMDLQQEISIESFTINTRAAVEGQENVDPLNTLQPIIPNSGPNPSVQPSVFFGDSLPCWQSDPVTVTPQAENKKFLLNFFVQALGTEDGLRMFFQDPEMVVGPDGFDFASSSRGGRDGSQADKESVVAHVAT